jgi:molecular chaperone DnaK
MYKAQQAQGGGEGAAPGAEGGDQPKDDNVVDAEFSEVDDDKKGAA